MATTHIKAGMRAVVFAATSTLQGLVSNIALAIYQVTQATASDGQAVPLQGDAKGNLRNVEQYAPVAEDNTNGVFATAYKPLAAATYCPSVFYIDSPTGAKGFIKAAAGNIFGFHAINNNGSIRYIQFCNTTDGTMTGSLSAQFAIPATSSLTITNGMLTAAGINLTVGVSYGFSTTQGSFVAGTAGNHSLTLTYA